MTTGPALFTPQLDIELDSSYDDTLARSESAIEQLRENFPNWSRAYVSDMRALTVNLPADADGARAAFENIHGIAHNLKGMGSSFGYPLISEAGQALCYYLRKAEASGQADKKVIETILKSLDVILEHRIAGDGGEVGRKLVAKLQAIVEDAVGKLPAA